MRLPINSKWVVDQTSDRGFAVLATKNISFDEQGYATLSNRTADVFDESDSASFQCPVAIYQQPLTSKELGIANAPFTVAINVLPLAITIDALSPQPTGSYNSSQAYYNNNFIASVTAGAYRYNGSAWVDLSLTLTSGVRHPLCVHRGNNTLLVGNGNQVKQYNTSYSETTNLSLPSEASVCGLAYNRNFAAVVTFDQNGHEAGLYIWDAGTAGANYFYPLGTSRALFVGAFKDTFIVINALGQVLRWDTNGLNMIGALPSYFTSAVLASLFSTDSTAHDTSIYIDGERIIFNLSTVNTYKGSESDKYNPLMPSGLWCWEQGVGLYHRNAPSGAKLNSQGIATANIDTTTDIITGTSIPATGTPFVYASADSVPMGGLTENTIYYVIKLSGTTFQVASTRALALAGTAINITSKASGSAYQFVFIPESDYGQLAIDSYAGIVTSSGIQGTNANTSSFTLFKKYLFGMKDVPKLKAAADVSDVFGYVMDRGENRGYIVWQWLYTGNVRDVFKKLYVKARRLYDENAKIIVKYRLNEASGFPQILRSTANICTWSTLGASTSAFTTTADLSALKTAFDANNIDGAYEIEIIAGAGSGYLAHITAITLNAGTYTVTIDEPIRNVSVNDTFFCVIDNWLKLQTKGAETAITSASDPDYSEFPIAGNSKKIQFKMELRGYRIQIENIDLVNSSDKPVV